MGSRLLLSPFFYLELSVFFGQGLFGGSTTGRPLLLPWKLTQVKLNRLLELWREKWLRQTDLGCLLPMRKLNNQWAVLILLLRMGVGPRPTMYILRIGLRSARS